MTVSDRIRIKDVRVLSDDHYVLKTTTFEWRRADGCDERRVASALLVSA